tara:strand:+ start:155 stop:514 length:360 start_codon:yes stop_codon:yes gene_type:complete
MTCGLAPAHINQKMWTTGRMKNGDQGTENLFQISQALPGKVNQAQLLDHKSRSPGRCALSQEKVRYGLEPDSPRLLQGIFGLVEETTDGYAKKSKKILNWSIFELLLQSIKDAVSKSIG